jgi:hypothetical protein
MFGFSRFFENPRNLKNGDIQLKQYIFWILQIICFDFSDFVEVSPFLNILGCKISTKTVFFLFPGY